MQLISGTPVADELKRTPKRFAGIRIIRSHDTLAQIEHRNEAVHEGASRKAVMRLLASVHAINRKPLLMRARDFEGVM
jgi:hypothetical protein